MDTTSSASPQNPRSSVHQDVECHHGHAIYANVKGEHGICIEPDNECSLLLMYPYTERPNQQHFMGKYCREGTATSMAVPFGAGRLLRMSGIRNTKLTQIGCCHCSCWDDGRFNLLSPFFHDQILRHITTISQQNDLSCVRIEHVDGIQCRLSSCV